MALPLAALLFRASDTQSSSAPYHCCRRTAPLAACCIVVALTGCRGDKSSRPPIHLQQNMDFQRRFEAQEANLFFDDHRAMRPPVPNTIALGELQEDDHYYRGKVDGKLATDIPMPLTKPLLRRGQQRFGIYCVVCHGAAGNSKSMLRTRNMRVPPPSFMEARLRSQPVGYFFHVITNGVRNMPSYAAQVPPSDRWAIAAYVRALQIAGSASIDQVPPSEAARKGWRVQ